jgi:hypothetical protein
MRIPRNGSSCAAGMSDRYKADIRRSNVLNFDTVLRQKRLKLDVTRAIFIQQNFVLNHWFERPGVISPTS